MSRPSRLALEIHDVGLTAVAVKEAVNGDGEAAVIGTPSPGFGLLDGGDLLTGASARDRARLAPRRVHHRFWHALEARTPLPRPFPPDWTAADLAHAHLEDVRVEIDRELRDEGEEPGSFGSTVLAVPGSFFPEQLGLLLGICRAAGISVAGLVDLALAAARASWDPTGDPRTEDRLLHLDLHLHRTVVTELSVREGSFVRRRVELVEAGRLALEDAWARALATAFVRASRFDPLHAAETEQALYRALPGWLDALETSGEASLSLDLGGSVRTVETTREEAVAVVEGLYRRMLEPVRALIDETLATPAERPPSGPSPVLLSAHAAGLPGLAERLRAAGAGEVEELAPGAAGRGALAAWDQIGFPGESLESEGGLPLILRLHRTGATDGAA